MTGFKFKITEIKADGALVSARITDARNNSFEITVGQCDGRIKRNTRGKWDSVVNQAAGIIRELHHTELVHGNKMPTMLTVDEAELRRWQAHDL